MQSHGMKVGWSLALGISRCFDPSSFPHLPSVFLLTLRSEQEFSSKNRGSGGKSWVEGKTSLEKQLLSFEPKLKLGMGVGKVSYEI